MEFPTFIAVSNFLSNGSLPTGCDNKTMTKIKKMASGYELVDGKLYVKEADPEYLGAELVHEGKVDEIIIGVHKEGHFGVKQTMRRLQLRFHIPRLEYHVKRIVQSCDACQYRARVVRKRFSPSNPIVVPKSPFVMIGCDAVGPVVPSKGGNRYILVAVDYLTRWPMAMAVPNINEETTVRFLYKQVISYGVPNYLLTDRGSNFTSGYVRNFLSSLGCKHITTTAYRPQTNGLCERMNQTLVQVLSKLVRDKDVEANWDEYLDETLFAVRTMVNDATGYSPGKLLYGYELVSPGVWPSPREDFVEGEFVESVVERIKDIKNGAVECRAVARARTMDKQKDRKTRYDKTVGARPRFVLGEQVLMKDPVPGTKFADKWLGPMVVTRVNQKGTYWLDGPNGRRLEGAVNGDVLKPYVARKSMVPDVVTKTAIDRYETWVERK